MKRDDAHVLLDIAHAARLVTKFVAGTDQAGFEADDMRRSAVLHELLVIGEAVKRLSPGFRSRNPGVPWSRMAGMRDRLIHAYDEVDLEEVWRTATSDIPDLLNRLKPLLPPENP
ncbi:MAG: DUF86 domain-containing protein [Candidatus Rokubacteria bacterium]|nr:DUF86 domain-containing protein [Candidatus Rokubacteria bacterium]